MLKGGEAQYWALSLMQGRQACPRRLLILANKNTSTPPVKLLIIRPYDCLCGSNLSPQSAKKLTDSAPRDQLSLPHPPRTSKMASHRQPVARRTQLGMELASPFWPDDDLKLVNALEIEEA